MRDLICAHSSHGQLTVEYSQIHEKMGSTQTERERERERESETAESTSKIKRYTNDGRKKTETAYRIAYRNYVVKTACFIGRKKST